MIRRPSRPSTVPPARRWRPWPAFALATLLLMLLPPSVRAETVRRYALLLTHDTGGPGTSRLSFTGDDADRVESVLTELGDVAPEDLHRLDRPSPGQVLDALARLKAELAGAPGGGEVRWLTVYYSGHADAQGLWLGSDLLPLDDLEAAVARTGAEVRLLVLDACASGALTQAKGGHRSPAFLVRVEDDPGVRGQVVLASSASDEASQESERLGGGIFTHHLVTGLRGAADRSDDGLVTLDEAVSYAYHHTLYDTAGSQSGVQHPTWRYDLAGRGELVLTRPAAVSTSLFFPAGSDGTYLIFDEGRRTFVGEIELKGEARRLSLPPGRYLVQKRQEDHLLAAEVNLSSGVSVRLEEADMERRLLTEDALKGVLVANRLRALGPRNDVRLTVGGQAFFDTPVRESLVPATPLVGLAWQRRGWPAEVWALRVDLGLGGIDTAQDVGVGEAVAVSFTELALGVGLLRLQPVGPVAVYGGARLAGLVLHRDFLPPLDQPSQTFVNVSPGVVGGIEVPLSRVMGVCLEGRAHYLYYQLGEDYSLGYTEVSFGTWLRF